MKLGLLILLLIATPAFGATPTDTTVAFYHGAPDRAGNYIVPGLTWQSAGAVRRDQAFDGQIEGHIYAQPLYWRPPGSERGLIITATENDLVYALDADTGRVVWRTSVGRPVPRAVLPCGNIDPLGITGTPVIDATHGAVYFDAMSDDRGAPRHLVYGLRLADGNVLPGFPIDVAAALGTRGINFTSAVQNQRGALALSDGRIFIPFGGHFGDCGDYHGAVVAVGVDPPQLLGAWITRAPKGGIWAPAGLSEADGSLFFSTGNTDGARGWQDGEGVFRVTPNLAHAIDPRDYFAPSNWKELDANDLDLGGVTPLPLTLPGSPIPLMLALGKDGNAYLLNRASLGGLGGAPCGARRDYHRCGGLSGARCGAGRLPGARCCVPGQRACVGDRRTRSNGAGRQSAVYSLVYPAGWPRCADRHHHGRQRRTDCLGRWRGGRWAVARFPRRYR